MSQTSNESTVTQEESQNLEVETAQENVPAEKAKTEKVELDIEDAPFLKEEEAPPVESSTNKEEGAKQEKPTAGSKKKKLIIIGAAAILLLVGGGAAAWFLLKPGGAEPPPPVVEEIKPEVIVVPSKQVAPVNPDVVTPLEQFIVPVGDSLAKTNFLICKFSIISKDLSLGTEIENKMIPLRDAVYFYLRSKSYDYLLTPANAKDIKSDLLGILNDFLTTGKVEDVLLDTYLGH